MGVFHISVDTVGCRVDTDQLPIPTAMGCKGQTNAMCRQWTRKMNDKGFLNIHEYYEEKRNICFLHNSHYTAFNAAKIQCHGKNVRSKSVFNGVCVETGNKKALMTEEEWDEELKKAGDYKNCEEPIKEHIAAMHIDLERNFMWQMYLNREALQQTSNWPSWSKNKLWCNWNTRDYMTQERWEGYKFPTDDGTMQTAKKLITLVGWDKLSD